jgi:phenol hydroxylase P3 protein
LLCVPFMVGAAHNGDLSTVTVGFSAQSDKARHLALGSACIQFLLAQDPANLPLLQGWIDKWFWRSYRLCTLVAMMQDYMLPKRVTSWKESWEAYAEEGATALFQDLARFGVRLPAGWADACQGKDHLSHQAWNAFYGYSASTAFHTWVPSDDELTWLTQQYPTTFNKYYRPRLEHYRAMEQSGKRWHNHQRPMVCSTCQFPMFFTEAHNPRMIAYRSAEHAGDTHHFCSDHCQAIFAAEPGKYLQAKVPVSLGMNLNAGRDNGEFHGSEDDRNFAQWGGGQSPKEGVI